MKTAISYYRKSIFIKGISEEDAIGYQKQSIVNYCNENNMKLIEEFSDIGFSGKSVDRPELLEMLEFLKATTFDIDCLLIYSIDRFGRDLRNNISTMLQISEYVERIVFVNESLSSDNVHFKTLFLLNTSIAQVERENLLRRLADGTKAKIFKRKRFLGNFSPLGFTKKKNVDKDSEEYGKLVPATFQNTNDLEEMEGLTELKFIFLAYLFGMSLRKISEHLNENFNFTRRGKKWTYKSVKYILQNPIYIGVLTGFIQKQENYAIENANVDKLIDPYIFDLIQYKLSLEKVGRKKKSSQNLPNLLVCQLCIHPMSFDQNDWVCNKCGGIVSSGDIHSLIYNEMIAISNGYIESSKMDSLFNEKKMTLIQKEKVIKEKAKSLEDRRVIVKHMFSDDQQTLDRLLAINNDELLLHQEGLLKVRRMSSLLESLEHGFLPDYSQKEVESLLLKLPFLIFVNVEKKEIELLFHRNTFKGELEICV